LIAQPDDAGPGVGADAVRRLALRAETFDAGGFRVRIDLPEASDELIDEAEFGNDERLPYWAELWPSARALASFLLHDAALPARAIELGCGVGLPSLALLSRGVSVLATDYYEDALSFARHNARANGLGELATRLLDWRYPPPDLPTFPLVVAADVLYEARNGHALLGLLPTLVEDGGRIVFTDPGRLHRREFTERMAASGWKVAELEDRLEASSALDGRPTRVTVLEFYRAVPKL